MWTTCTVGTKPNFYRTRSLYVWARIVIQNYTSDGFKDKPEVTGTCSMTTFTLVVGIAKAWDDGSYFLVWLVSF